MMAHDKQQQQQQHAPNALSPSSSPAPVLHRGWVLLRLTVSSRPVVAGMRGSPSSPAPTWRRMYAVVSHRALLLLNDPESGDVRLSISIGLIRKIRPSTPPSLTNRRHQIAFGIVVEYCRSVEADSQQIELAWHDKMERAEWLSVLKSHLPR